MADFFREQLDYILFFYGLGFILLSVVCFILWRDKRQRLPWIWFGLFGLTHGVHEWLDIIAVNFALGRFLGAAHSLFLVASFLFLLEFGRSGERAVSGRGPDRKIFVLLLAFTALGGLAGYSGLNATARYVLGMTGGLWTARVLFIESRSLEGGGRRWLLAGCAAIGLYAVTATVATEAPFFPASFIHSNSFLLALGFPIQFLRGVIAISVTVSIWVYSQKELAVKEPDLYVAKPRHIFRPVIILAVIIAAGWLFTIITGDHARDEEAREGRLFLSALSSHLSHVMKSTMQLTEERANSPSIIRALLTGRPGDMKEARSILDHCKMDGECTMPACCVLDRDGRLLLSCARGDAAFVHELYRAPGLIKKVLAGKRDGFFIAGKPTEAPRYFTASPVRDGEGRVIGATVVDQPLGDIEASFRERIYCFLVDREGTVFMSGREGALMRSLWLSGHVPAAGDRAGKDGPLMPEEPWSGKYASMNGSRFLASRQHLGSEGWSLIYLGSINHIRNYRLFSIFVTFVFCNITIGFFWATYFTRESAVKLEKLVKERTTELSGSNTLLQQEINERMLAEKAIEQVNHQKELILKAAGEGIYGLDLEGCTTFANPAAARMIGWGINELIGKRQHDIMHHSRPDGTGYPAEECPIYAVLRDGVTRHVSDEVFWRKDGTSFPVEYVSTAIMEEGVIKGAVVVFNDITESKRAEEHRHMYTTKLEKYAVELDKRNSDLKSVEGELRRYREHLEHLISKRTAELIKTNENLQNEIAGRKRVEAELQESKHFVQRILDTTPNLLYIYDVIEKRNVYTNREVAELLGYTTVEIKKMGSELFNAILHPEDANKVEEHHGRFFSAKDAGVLEVEYRMRRADGQWRWLHSCDVVFSRTPDGRVRQILGVAEDITERKIADEILKHSEERFRKLSMEFNTLLDAIPDALMLLSPDMKVMWANNSAGTILGRDVAGLAGQYCHELWQGRLEPCDKCAALECFGSGKIEASQSVTADGRLWSVRAFPMKDDDGKVGNVVVLTCDITEKITLQAEALRAGQLAALGELAAGMAHEINNPVSSIINYAQIILDENEDIKAVKDEVSARIIKEGERIAGIIRSLLSFARDRKEGKCPVEVRGILSDSLALAEAQLRKDGIRLDVNLSRDLPGIFAHAQQIQQVFLNIINNARYALNQKYAGAHEEKKFEIYGEEMTFDNTRYARIRFFDRGTGIPSGIIDKVMNPFFSTKPSGQGTGLGLSISHGIISDHGGRITIDSMEGNFTRVTIDLPAVQKEEGA